MPNLIAHFGVGGVATRALARDSQSLWIYTGCMIPDCPWILQRAVTALDLGVNPYELRLYAVVQASLAGCLLLASAVALCTAEPAKVLGILAINSTIHLLLDACQTKWANGVHLLAPFSWHTWNLRLFWPESALTLAITVFGACYVVFDARRWWHERLAFAKWDLRRVTMVGVLIVTYFALPLAAIDGPLRADAHFVRTLTDGENRAGRYIELDRNRYIPSEHGGVVNTFAGENVRVVGDQPAGSTAISLRGRFVDENTIAIIDFHEHPNRSRDAASMAGLAFLALVWLRAMSSQRAPY